MTTLITGGAGFIGSHLAEELLKRGEETYIVDDLSTGSIENVTHLKGNPKFHYAIDTIMNKQLMAELVDTVDVIFHLAASVGVRLIIDSPVHTISTNIRGTDMLLELAAKKKKKVIIASTSEVYGKGNKIPFNENDDSVLGPTIKSRWSYACSKLIDEFLALAYFKEKRLPIVITRLFNTVGPRQNGRYGMVIPTFVEQALSGEPITVYGDGNQTRCFSWVGDIVNGLIALSENPKAIGDVFNIGNDKEIMIRDLAKLVKELSNSDSDIVYIPYEQAYQEGFEDMRKRVPDISRIKKLVNFTNTLELTEILTMMINYYSKDKNIYLLSKVQ
ncbi:GDP-mannose 4,6-dehydratase [Desulfobacterota bacterium AH_259_B03_O07]|nr:GDP-mannose 4,6-dehydratase [Desulfobacterota bacterium AH_259_B03_O07]